MNLLIFDIQQDFAPDIQLVANNEHDLREYLQNELGYTSIEFYDIETSYGRCLFKDKSCLNTLTANCKYAKKI